MPAPLAIKLRNSLQGAARLAVLAIGSDLRGDDAAGSLIAQHLTDDSQHTPKQTMLGGGADRVATGTVIEIFQGGSAPENTTGAIKAFAPTHLLIVDAADMGLPPGSADLIDRSALAASSSMSTHSLPLGVLLDYLESFLHCRSIIMGIQPAHRDFGRPVTPAVATACRDAAQAIIEALDASDVEHG